MNIINRYTLQTLKKNKLRTMVTIIGIILSAAMFTGVTSIVFSLQQFLINVEIGDEGAWEGRLNNLSRDEAEKFLSSKDVKGATVVDTVGYARMQDSLNESKPYLCIKSIEKDFADFSPLRITEGRMAENSDELVLSKHLEENGGISYHVGDTITLEVGKRMVDGKAVGQATVYMGKEESVEQTRSKTYRIVGICERPAVERYSAPGYTALTVGAGDACFSDVLFTSEKPKEIGKQMKSFLIKKAGRDKGSIEVDVDYVSHGGLLRFRGESPNESFMSVFYTMGCILTVIIMVASVTLIYNAFSISVSERTKQFGLLKSIGATKKQIRHSVYFEGLCLCGIGIPIGVVGGLAGIGVTLYFVDHLIGRFMNKTDDIHLSLTIMPSAIVIAVVIAVVTVLISSMIPAAKAVRLTAIDALRESRDVRIRSRNVRTGRWVYRFFGFEGMLANKNFKRNRKKYRLTVFSLAISIILFIVTSCFNRYMSESVNLVQQASTTDIRLIVNRKEMVGVSAEDARKGMERVQDVEEAAYAMPVEYAYLLLDKEDLDKDFYDFNMSADAPDNYIFTHKKSDKVLVNAALSFVDDTSYEKYLKKNHMDVSKFMDGEKLCPIIWDEVQGLNSGSAIMKCHVFKKNRMPKEIYCLNKVKEYEYLEDFEKIDAEKMAFPFVKAEKENNGTGNKGQKESGESEEKIVSGKKAVTKLTLDDIERVELASRKAPLGIGSVSPWFNGVTMVLPCSAMNRITETSKNIGFGEYTSFNFKATNYKKAYTNLSEYLKNSSGFKKDVVSQLYSERETAEANRALLIVLDIFVYGFITLIVLIVMANIFNTISTNIQLRRKEFAMLKSVGMAKRGFDRMMNFECLLYGVKSLVIGLPISFVLCYLMCKSMEVGWNAAFSIPWGNVAIVVVGVFVMVFGSMLYSMRKINRDNPIEALRNDNL